MRWPKWLTGRRGNSPDVDVERESAKLSGELSALCEELKREIDRARLDSEEDDHGGAG